MCMTCITTSKGHIFEKWGLFKIVEDSEDCDTHFTKIVCSKTCTTDFNCFTKVELILKLFPNN